MFAPKRAGRAMRLLWRIRRRMRAGPAPTSEQMHRVRREQPKRHEAEAEQAEAAGMKLSTTMPVMTVAEASTMPIWNAADANS